MPELEPLNHVEASASTPIPLATQKEEKKACYKLEECEEQIKQDLLDFRKQWNPLNLEYYKMAQHEQTEDPNRAVKERRSYYWYSIVWHFYRDTSKLVCLIAILGLPWNQPAIFDDTFFASYFYVSGCFVTAWISFSTRPKIGGTFFRTVLNIEKTRESIATKRKAFGTHMFLLFCYCVAYAWCYIQSSCLQKHYGPYLNEWNFTQIQIDRNGIEPCRYKVPFPGEPITLNRTYYREKNMPIPLTFWVPGLSTDALLPNSLSFYVVVIAYFAKVIVDLFLYDDVYSHIMLPSPAFIQTHYPTIFAKAKEIIIKQRTGRSKKFWFSFVDRCGGEKSIKELMRIAKDEIDTELAKSEPKDRHAPFLPTFFEPYIPIKEHLPYWFLYDSSKILRNIIIVCDRVSAYVQKHEPSIDRKMIVSAWRNRKDAGPPLHKAILDKSLEWGHIEHMCIGDIIKVHEFLHVGLALSNTVISAGSDGNVFQV